MGQLEQVGGGGRVGAVADQRRDRRVG